MTIGAAVCGMAAMCGPVNAARASEAANQGVAVMDPPIARSPVELYAANDRESGRATFRFRGEESPPVIMANPGQTLVIVYRNEMSHHSGESCVDGPCTNMTNLHFHGLHVSPNAPQDDVISMMVMPGQSIRYAVKIPLDQPPGLYWYHPHPHGESYQQTLDGMSGAVVIEGIEKYVPAVRGLRERVLVLRDAVVPADEPAAAALRQSVAIPLSQCGTAAGRASHVFTINGTVRPSIPISPGEKQFWRIVNASPDLYADLQVDGQSFDLLAVDGMPLAFHDPLRRTSRVDHLLVPPAGRVEVIVTGPRVQSTASLRTRCFDTGPDGDPNPEMILADLVQHEQSAAGRMVDSPGRTRPLYKKLSERNKRALERGKVQFTVTFSEDARAFYINGRQYRPTDPPMITVTVGRYQHWRVVNATHEVHPFHIHQVHFLAYAQNGAARDPLWLDTVNVPPEGSVDLLMDFTDPVIRGVSLFHCHLLKHEDKGMMAKILFR
jgi:FtsP/CotA-like multicopper oxidase with cupredoxin domain